MHKNNHENNNILFGRLEGLRITKRGFLLEEFNFCTHPYSNTSVDRAGTPNPSSK